MQGKGKTIALVGLLVLLIGLAAWMWWPDSAPPLPANTVPDTADQPPPAPRPGQQNQPDAPAPTAKQPHIISG